MAKLLKFALVGGSGTVLNLGLFLLLVDGGKMSPTLGAVLCFAAAVTSNYLLNHIWTFQTQIGCGGPSAARYLRFIAVSLAGLGVNLGALNLALALFHPACKVFGQAAGIACGMTINFIGSNLFAFHGKLEGRKS